MKRCLHVANLFLQCLGESIIHACQLTQDHCDGVRTITFSGFGRKCKTASDTWKEALGIGTTMFLKDLVIVGYPIQCI